MLSLFTSASRPQPGAASQSYMKPLRNVDHRREGRWTNRAVMYRPRAGSNIASSNDAMINGPMRDGGRNREDRK